MRNNLPAAKTPPCRCGQGGSICFICGKKPEEISNELVFYRNEKAGICEPCVEFVRNQILTHHQLKKGSHHA